MRKTASRSSVAANSARLCAAALLPDCTAILPADCRSFKRPSESSIRSTDSIHSQLGCRLSTFGQLALPLSARHEQTWLTSYAVKQKQHSRLGLYQSASEVDDGRLSVC